MATAKNPLRGRVQAQTPIEKIRAQEIAELFKDGKNPLTVTVHPYGGHYRYTADDVANYMEMYKVPFSPTVSCFRFVGDMSEFERHFVPVASK